MRKIEGRTLEDLREANARTQRNYQDRLDPGLKARREIKKYSSKKEQHREQMGQNDTWESKLLEDLILSIREILSKKEV